MPAVPGARVIDLADRQLCWSRLRTETHGKLSSRGTQHLVSLDVTYTVEDEQVLVSVPSDDDVLHALADLEVVLALSGRAEDGLRWVVRVTGVADLSLVGMGTDAPSRSSHPARGAASRARLVLRLPVDRLRGYHETPLDPVAEPL